MNTGCMFRGIDRDALAFFRGHPRLAVTGKAAFILFEGMRRFRLCARPRICRGNTNRNNDKNAKCNQPGRNNYP